MSVRQAVVAEPFNEESALEEPVVEPVNEMDVEESENPLTNDVPPAVVMGAASAPEEVAEEPVSQEIQSTNSTVNAVDQ